MRFILVTNSLLTCYVITKGSSEKFLSGNTPPFMGAVHQLPVMIRVKQSQRDDSIGARGNERSEAALDWVFPTNCGL